MTRITTGDVPVEDGEPGVLGELRSGFTHLAVVGADTVRLLLGHAPVLFAVVLTGVGVHALLVEAAFRVSYWYGPAGLLTLMTAPLAMLAAFVVALRAMAPSLRGARAEGDDAPEPADAADGPPGPRARLRRTMARLADGLGDVGSLVVPFVALYELAGYVTADVRDYSYKIALESSSAAGAAALGEKPDPLVVDPNRTGFNDLRITLAIAAGAFVVRWLIGRVRRPGPRRWLALPAAYVEVVWLTIGLVAGVRALTLLVGTWVAERRVTVWVEDAYARVTDVLGPLGPAARAVAEWVGTGLASVDRVLFLPLGWLTVAAVVYGRHLGPTHTAQDEAEVTRLARMRRGLAARFEGLVVAVRHLRHLGPVPGVLYCLGFLLVWSSHTALWELDRWLIGPREFDLWQSASATLERVNSAVGLVLVLCFVAAAADRAIRTTGTAQGRPAQGDAGPPDPQATRELPTGPGRAAPRTASTG